ncbi:predicted protein [Ostreococcus lucimarinus CCE9901]|uniref:Uncharacterized protein n=1 Tax=Ostreococcus lucimarinus (strain CCE9901) TaxID=436017 RepID=A4S2F1_OSTLU|nr:predicted protein [Ostreococcus lucimarinus CCE9901]ABO97815.1 predicted protein [Ostreococcus lucimarinus CCE9901]|eukprot:XP_001419522.1 predicted protein [Ostreococcus lucimarinus CCE9901]
MGATALTAVFGAVSGVGCAAFANGLRKLPPFSQPWKHAVAAGVGAAALMYNADLETSLKEDVERLRATRAEQNAEYMAEIRAKR